MSGDFWRGRSVLITGHTGFKGSWLALWLSQLGARVVGYALAPETSPSLFELARVGGRVHSIQADVCDLDQLAQCVDRHRPEVVFHLAAQSLVRPSYADPVSTYRTNVLGTVHVLEAVRRHPGTKAVVVVTSDKCYENSEWQRGYREGDAMGGYDPYSSSKGCAELVTSAYRRSYFHPEDYGRHGLGVASARAGNVIGGGDWAIDRLVPDIVNAYVSKRELVLRNPSAVRPWQYVLEPLQGYLMLAERLCGDGARFAEAWNFGPADEDVLTVEAIVTKLSAHLKNGIRYRVERAGAPHEANTLRLDCTKARTHLGWRPRTSVDDAVKLVAEWHNDFLAGRDMQVVSLAQIKAFESRELVTQ